MSLAQPTGDNRNLLLSPPHLFTAAEVLTKPSPVPKVSGVYAWYFDEIPPGVPTDDCHTIEDWTLLYVGIAPKAPPANGRPPSKTNLYQRVRYHLMGNAEGSTLRLTLGCLLGERLNVQLRRVGSGTTMTFTNPGEQRLDAWMADHARVAWVETAEPWVLENALIGILSLPLNLAQNAQHTFGAALRGLRRNAVTDAMRLPILDRGGARAGPKPRPWGVRAAA